MARAIGIDLGTTNSLVAYVDDRNRPQVVMVDEKKPLLPSAVYYRMDGGIEVGAAAKRGAPDHPVDTILSVTSRLPWFTASFTTEPVSSKR